MNKMDEFKENEFKEDEFEPIKQHLINIDPKLSVIFGSVDINLYDIIKTPYTALLGAIIGQKISYQTAKSLRSKLYSQFGTNIQPNEIINSNLSFLGASAIIIHEVTRYILNNNVNLETEEGIRSLINVKGIGIWTIETTLLTCMKNWDIFPLDDKFLQVRMKRLYGVNTRFEMEYISSKWSPYRSLVTWHLWRWF